MRKSFFFFISILVIGLSAINEAGAQQYKIRQSSSMMGMKMESTVYVKGMRKRTESAPMMGMSVPVTIEQCDLKRTIKLNDKKKLYYIEPFGKETDEVVDEDAKPAAVKTKPLAASTNTRAGGTIHMWYSITDTGERKKMNGFTARHVWTYQKMKPTPDACSMKDSLIIKTDGWYIDLPEFNCPVKYNPGRVGAPTAQPQPECIDKFVTHRSGKGKLGFPLTETRTMIMGGKTKTDEFVTTLETIELTTQKLDSMLFEIPPGYTETKNEADLQDKFNMADMMKQQEGASGVPSGMDLTGTGKDIVPGMILVGVYEPKSDGQVQGPVLQQHLVMTLSTGTVKGIAISSEEDARKYNCTYTLSSDLIKIKQASKVGGILKAIKNTDPNAATSYTIEGNQVLKKLDDGSIRLQPRLDGKYDGKVDDAAKKALDEGTRKVISALE